MSARKEDTLTEDHLRDYFFNGFINIPDFFTKMEILNLQIWSEEVCYLEGDAAYETAAGERVLCRKENFVDAHEGWNSIARGRIAHVVGQLVDGDKACLFKEKINYKAPGGGGRVNLYFQPCS